MSKFQELLDEVQFIEGDVISDPQTWSETKVSGSGGGGAGHYTSPISISSTVTTWTSFLLELQNGKELSVKWPEGLSLRKGHNIKVAMFRGGPIALVNEKTDTNRYLTNLHPLKYWNGSKAFPSWLSYGALLAFVAPLAYSFSTQTGELDEPLSTLLMIGIVVWPILFLIGIFRKRSVYQKASKKLGLEALRKLEAK